MNSRPQQRQRMPNFTPGEENILRTLAKKYQKSIEASVSNAHVWRLKNQAWDQIALEFYNLTKVERSAARLRSKYDCMKKLDKSKGIKFYPKQQSEYSNNNNNNNNNNDVKSTVNVVEEGKPLIKQEIKPKPEDIQPAEAAPEAARANNNGNGPVNTLTEIKPITPVEQPGNSMTDQAMDTEPGQNSMRLVVPQYQNVQQGGLQIASANSIANLNVKPLPSNDQENRPHLPCKHSHSVQQNIAAQFTFYRNRELRAQEKHLAELQNLGVQHQILKLELQAKQRELDKSNK